MSDINRSLVVIDDDSIFRLGLCTALENEEFSQLQVIASGEISAISQILAQKNPDLLILGLAFNPLMENHEDLQLCLWLTSNYPDLDIFLLVGYFDSQKLIQAKAYGIKGYSLKKTSINQIVEAIEIVKSGEIYWPALLGEDQKPKRRKKLKTTGAWLYQQCRFGLDQIQSNIDGIDTHLKQSKIPKLDWLFWKGRKRELLMARWFVNQLLPPQIIESQPKSLTRENQPTAITYSPPNSIIPPSKNNQLIPSTLFENTWEKIDSNVINTTGMPLEIDILQDSKKQELFLIVLNQFNKILEELHFLKVTEEELSDRISLVLRQLWQNSTIDLMSRYSLEVQNNPQSNSLVNIMVEDGFIVQEAILNQIVFVKELLAYLLFEKPLIIDNVSYRVEAPEAISRAQIFLDNLIIHIANATMQIIINNFYDQERIKENLYQKRLRTSRVMAKFRNDLSGKYRKDKYIIEPQNIFEDKYRLFTIDNNQIQQVYIYASRKEELNQLTGLRWAITMAIEIRDALGPSLKGIVDWLGKGIVFLLTKVIGKGIGLIGKGVIQGIGNTLPRGK